MKLRKAGSVFVLLLALSVLSSWSAQAITGDAPPATGWAARPIVMVLDDRGDLCTGTALAPDLVLTAAHCVRKGVRYEIRAYQTGETARVRTVVQYPGFNPAAYCDARPDHTLGHKLTLRRRSRQAR